MNGIVHLLTALSDGTWQITGSALDSQDWGSHTGYVLVFPSPAARDAYRAAVADSPDYEEPGLITARVPVGRYALFGAARTIRRDREGRATLITFDPADLSTVENGWFEGTTGGDTLLADEDRLTPADTATPFDLAVWLTRHGIPTHAL